MSQSISPANSSVTRAPGDFVSRAWQPLTIAAVIGLAIPTAIVAIAEGVGAFPLPFNLHVVDLRLPLIFKLHMLASGLALLIIPFVVWLRHHRRLHKPLGRLAAISVLIGGITSLPVALLSDSVALARAGFFAQGVVWLALIAAGYRAIRTRQFQAHARLMLMMAAVASGAIWVRLVTAVAVADAGSFEFVYAAVTWLGWLVPLAVVERLTRWETDTRPRSRQSSHPA